MLVPSNRTDAISLKGVLIYYPIIFLAFTLVNVIASLYPIEVSSVTHVLFPIIVMCLFGMLTRFGYIKLNSLVIGRVLIILAALGWGDTSIHWVYLILLQLNILEAVLLDGYKKNYLNACSGLLVLISSFYLMLGWTGSYITIDNKSYIFWILAYTVWNANFVSLQLSGGYYLHHFLILLSPIAACLVLSDFSIWLMLRETSLLLGIATLASVKKRLQGLEQQKIFVDFFEKAQTFIRNPKTQFVLLSVVGICILIQWIKVN